MIPCDSQSKAYTRHAKWPYNLIQDTKGTGFASATHKINRMTTLLEWATLPYVRDPWENRNSLIHVGDIFTDVDLLPPLLLNESSDDHNIRLIDTF